MESKALGTAPIRGGVTNQVWFKALDFSSDKFQMVLGRLAQTALRNEPPLQGAASQPYLDHSCPGELMKMKVLVQWA